MSELDPIERLSFADQAYRTLRAAILSGAHPPGAPLVESRIAAQLGVSRGPVREALQRLGEEGLVVDGVHRRAEVRTFTVDDVVDLYNLRLGLETVAIRLAARRRAPTASLRSAIDGMAAAGRARDNDALTGHETAFHEALAALSDNPYVVSTFASVAAQVRMAMALDNAAYGDPLEVAREHEPLVAAIDDGDEERASKLLADHICGSIEPTLRRLAGDRADTLWARLLRRADHPGGGMP